MPLVNGLTTSRAADPSLPLRYMVAGLVFAVAAFGFALAYMLRRSWTACS